MRKKLKVGDEVFDVTAPDTRALVTRVWDGHIYVVFSDGSCGEEEYDIFKRTGRRFEIKHILDELH